MNFGHLAETAQPFHALFLFDGQALAAGAFPFIFRVACPALRIHNAQRSALFGERHRVVEIDQAIGLLLHDTVAFTEEGTPLGVVDAQCWARDPDIWTRRKACRSNRKESMKWLRSFRKVAEIQKACPDTKLISIGDRESDVYELFMEALRDPAGPGLRRWCA